MRANPSAPDIVISLSGNSANCVRLQQQAFPLTLYRGQRQRSLRWRV